MLLPVLNLPVITYAKQIMALMSYQIALPAMIKGKLTKCYVIMKVKVVKSLVQMILYMDDKIGNEVRKNCSERTV